MTTRAAGGLDRTIDRIGRLLPPALVPAGAQRDLQIVAAQLPASLSSCVYFETPLSAASERVDLIVRVDRAARPILTRARPAPLEPALPNDEIWARIRDLAALWQSSDSILSTGGHVIWLEFDVQPGAHTQTDTNCRGCPPGVFVDFTAAAFNRPSNTGRFELVSAALAPLIDAEALRRHFATVQRCIDVLPPGCAIPSVGVLLPRGGTQVRLCVLGLEENDLAPYLAAIGWPGSARGVAGLLRSLATPADTARPRLSLLHVDIGPDVLPRIGIEYRFRRDSQLRGEVREAAFLDRLVHAGLCAPSKRDAMITFPGCTVEQMPHELWRSVVVRRLNHVKVLYEESAPVSAKGYLRVSHAFRPRPQDVCGAVQMQGSTQ